jgi:hypothetical protein
VKQPDYVKMVSFSDLWLMKLVHVVVKVTWEMRLISVSETECKFQNTVLVEHPHFIMKVLSALALGGFLCASIMKKKHPYLLKTSMKGRSKRKLIESVIPTHPTSSHPL